MDKPGFREKQELINRLQRESQDVMDEITRYYERFLEEFDEVYPPLSYVDHLRLTESTIKQWLTRHLERKA